MFTSVNSHTHTYFLRSRGIAHLVLQQVIRELKEFSVKMYCLVVSLASLFACLEEHVMLACFRPSQSSPHCLHLLSGSRLTSTLVRSVGTTFAPIGVCSICLNTPYLFLTLLWRVFLSHIFCHPVTPLQ